jgi:Pyruvate/2-oxoglutarate dehydrogenase complex, dihydrolipoamide dehydrogenase (E3) component, and related enzymes
MPLLRLRAFQDDGSRRQSHRRDQAGARHGRNIGDHPRLVTGRARIRDEATDDWNDKVAADRFAGKGGHLVRGRGKITGASQVTVTGAEGTRVLVARKGIVINTGTDPAIPPLEGLADTPYWTNREVVQAERVPQSLIVLGGGAIGAEFTQVFARFGTAVTLVEALPGCVRSRSPRPAS